MTITLSNLKNPIHYIVSIGDSKSATPINCWQYPLITYLQGDTNYNWDILLNHSTAGWTVANAESSLSVALSSVSLTPNLVFVDIGINDTSGTPTPQVSFEASYNSILNQCRSKWSQVPIYVQKVWRSGGGFATPVANVNTYISNSISGRFNVYVGSDQTVWLDSWDSDGIHPTVAGYFEYARQLRASMDF